MILSLSIYFSGFTYPFKYRYVRNEMPLIALFVLKHIYTITHFLLYSPLKTQQAILDGNLKVIRGDEHDLAPNPIGQTPAFCAVFLEMPFVHNTAFCG